MQGMINKKHDFFYKVHSAERHSGSSLHFVHLGKRDRSKLYNSLLLHSDRQGHGTDRSSLESIEKREAAIYTADTVKRSAMSEGVLYVHDWGFLYVPDCLSADTQWGVFFPGGYEHELPDWAFEDYIEAYHPNAVLLAFFKSGYQHKAKTAVFAAEVLNQVAKELDLPLKNVVAAGASNGTYVALKLAAHLCSEGVEAAKCLLFDPGIGEIGGYPYSDKDMPDEEERKALAKAGTMLCFFEQHGTQVDNVLALQRLAEAEANVVIIACHHQDHERIALNCWTLGVFSWAFGETELDPDEYTLAEGETDSCA